MLRKAWAEELYERAYVERWDLRPNMVKTFGFGDAAM